MLLPRPYRQTDGVSAVGMRARIIRAKPSQGGSINKPRKPTYFIGINFINPIAMMGIQAYYAAIVS